MRWSLNGQPIAETVEPVDKEDLPDDRNCWFFWSLDRLYKYWDSFDNKDDDNEINEDKDYEIENR